MVGVAMSEDNVEIVRSGLGVFTSTGELSAAIAPDLVWDMSTFQGWPEDPLYHRREGFGGFLAAWRDPYDDWSLSVEQVLDAGGDQVVALVTQRGRPHGSDSEVHLRYGLVFSLDDGLIRRIQAYATAAEAMEAVGLRD
jgi:ketosteroid isomerase-like protein